MDLVGPLPPSKGNQYLLTIVDRFTRWPEAYPIADSTTTTVVQAFLSQYVSRFGVPLTVTTDRGSQFESRFFAELSNWLGTKHSRTTAYHPQANGMVERLHRQLKAALMARANTVNWSDDIAFVLLGIRTAIKDDINTSAAELVYGQQLRLPSELVHSTDPPPISEILEKLRNFSNCLKPTETRKSKTVTFVPESMDTCKFVFIRVDRLRPGLTPPYEGPFKVLRRFRKHIVIDLKGKNYSVSLDRVKPAYTLAETLEGM